MSFTLHIPGWDDIQVAPVAKVANQRIDIQPSANLRTPANDAPNSTPATEPIRRFAGVAAPEVCEIDHKAMLERSAIISANGTPYWKADQLAGLRPWTEEEIGTFLKRQARIVWLGYAGPSEYLAEKLVGRDRDMDERRLCVECSHAGTGWRCEKKAGFLLEQFQRCDHFMESTK